MAHYKFWLAGRPKSYQWPTKLCPRVPTPLASNPYSIQPKKPSIGLVQLPSIFSTTSRNYTTSWCFFCWPVHRFQTKRLFWLYSAKQRNRRLTVFLRFQKQRTSLSRTLSDCNRDRSPASPTSIGEFRCLRMGTTTTPQLQMGGRTGDQCDLHHYQAPRASYRPRNGFARLPKQK